MDTYLLQCLSLTLIRSVFPPFLPALLLLSDKDYLLNAVYLTVAVQVVRLA